MPYPKVYTITAKKNWPVFVIEQVQQELQIIVIVFILCLVADSRPDLILSHISNFYLHSVPLVLDKVHE